MKVLIVGSSGMVGRAVLLECLDDARVESVLVVNRKSIGMSHPKLKEIIRADLHDLAPIEPEFAGLNACFYCLGVASAGMSEEAYSRITYGLTVAFADALLRKTSGLVFCFVSGRGTDSTEKGKIMWARVKGKAENAVLGRPFKSAHCFRPGLIKPLRGVSSRTAAYRFFYILFAPFMPIFMMFPSFSTTSVKIGRAMINAASGLADKKILESADINRLADRRP